MITKEINGALHRQLAKDEVLKEGDMFDRDPYSRTPNWAPTENLHTHQQSPEITYYRKVEPDPEPQTNIVTPTTVYHLAYPCCKALADSLRRSLVHVTKAHVSIRVGHHNEYIYLNFCPHCGEKINPCS